ncbi:hypothetical protein L207DRAFT_482501 [Hyaloscypha variabilis F]|uniref:DUF6594 domain-containing protein n=1 Tax=Hyaloscypha variabilis (strain UAMH 11265 / GT02V1 / F) TaxID=1149755 RepID=A0A2J6RZG2_HYAVF|nr:hypothetical protein L207DRAFT_482501 [Hyaloscypha variabilis F]
MSRASAPTLRRNHSSSDGSCVDPYDKAEQGFQIGSEDLSGSRPPLVAQKIHSFRSSLRSSDSTLVGLPEDAVDDSRRPLPDQDQLSRTISWTSWCFDRLPRVSFSRPLSQKSESPALPPADYQEGYDQFQVKCYDEYPNGWPRVAAFLESCDSFSMYRRFGQSHSRLLVTHQCNITDLETQIQNLDKDDDEGGPDMQFRLKTRYHEEGFDTKKRDLLEKLERELLAYDALLLNHHRLKSMDATPHTDHHSVFKWIWQKKPLDNGEFNWIFHPGDFVSMISPRKNRFENSIRRYLHSSAPALKSFFKSTSRAHETGDSSVEFFCQSRINSIARLGAIFFAISLLLVPLTIFLLVSMSKPCMIAVVLAFVLIFSLVISVFFEANFQEIFISTATYCAVLVTVLVAFLGGWQGAQAG